MSNLRLKYFDLSPEAMQAFRAVKGVLAKSVLGSVLLELVYLRISQINGCSFCLDMHTKALREHGESQQRLDVVAGWRVSTLFTPKERAALEWAEALTDVTTTHADDTYYLPLKEYLSDVEIADLTFAVALMNALNRLAIGMRQ